jgi:prevent-host-death family protein
LHQEANVARKYSIAEARDNLAALVHDLEKSERIELTRRGEPVAVLLSLRAYRRLTAPRGSFWEAYRAFREAYPLEELDIQTDVFEGVRDSSPGRDTAW